MLFQGALDDFEEGTASCPRSRSEGPQEALALIRRAEKQRRTSATASNEQSAQRRREPGTVAVLGILQLPRLLQHLREARTAPLG